MLAPPRTPEVGRAASLCFARVPLFFQKSTRALLVSELLCVVSLEHSGGFPLATLSKPVIDVSPFYISSPSAKRSRRAGLKYRLEKRSRVRLMASDGSEGKSRRCLDRNFRDESKEFQSPM